MMERSGFELLCQGMRHPDEEDGVQTALRVMVPVFSTAFKRICCAPAAWMPTGLPAGITSAWQEQQQL